MRRCSERWVSSTSAALRPVSMARTTLVYRVDWRYGSGFSGCASQVVTSVMPASVMA